MLKKDKESDTIHMVVFLGNPGLRYRSTRHNLAWMLADTLEETASLSWKSKFNGLIAGWRLDSNHTLLLKPQTFMNQSGRSVQAAMDFHRIPPESTLVVHDDIELDFGTVDLKSGGGFAGHNGLRSIAKCTGVSSFLRFRMGISRPGHGNAAGFVLSSFSNDESCRLPVFLDQSLKILIQCIQRGFKETQPQYQKIQIMP